MGWVDPASSREDPFFNQSMKLSQLHYYKSYWTVAESCIRKKWEKRKEWGKGNHMKGFKKEGKKELEGFLEGNCNKAVSQFPLMLCCIQNTSFSKMHSSDFSVYSLLKCFVWFSHDGMLLQLLHNDPHLQLLQTHVPATEATACFHHSHA